MGWKVVLKLGQKQKAEVEYEAPPEAQAGRHARGRVFPADEDEDDGAGARALPVKQRARRIRRVVFDDGGSGWGLVASALFAKMAHPKLAVATAPAPVDAALRRSREALLQEIGVAPAAAMESGTNDAPYLVVTLGQDVLGEARPRRETWPLPSGSLPPEQSRQARDELRERVWRLVAREGWYRLQPATQRLS